MAGPGPRHDGGSGAALECTRTNGHIEQVDEHVDRPVVICLTPVKNEEWILDRFLACASLWADHIVVADQGSDDRSREIARRFSKVTLIENDSEEFNEPERQKLLIDAARQIPGPRLLVALDADEFLTANHLEHPEWQSVLEAEPGTVVQFPWPTILSGAARYWLYPAPMPLGFMDDGSEHVGRKIHSPRVPLPPHAPILNLHRVAVMHYVGVDMGRWKSRLRWYQCWEHLNRPEQRTSRLYRFYHKDLCVPEEEIHDVPVDWLKGYEERGIDMTGFSSNGMYRWDRETLALLEEHGVERFRKLAIWDVDWNKQRGRREDMPSGAEIRDPREPVEKLVHWWLQLTQHFYSHFSPEVSAPDSRILRSGDRILRRLGW